MRAAAFRPHDHEVHVEGSTLPPPVLTYQVPERIWRLQERYAYADAEHGCTIVIAAGFLFDLSSVPRPLWGLIAPFDLSIVAPLLHDFLYRYGGRPPAGSIVPARVGEGRAGAGERAAAVH